MVMTHPTGDQPGPSDEVFLERLSRGSELLASGRALEAREHLEAAFQLRPKSAKAQNLLGLCCFKLGTLGRAAEIYELLVRENPVDATLRVNLGLVYLKSGALQRAVREFETAIELSPKHIKAHNYLGLTLAQAGEYGRAREHFLLAGAEPMADRMARAISGEGFSRVAVSSPAPLQAPSSESMRIGPEIVSAEGAVNLPRLEDNWGAQFGLAEEPETFEAVENTALLALGTQEGALAAAADPELDFSGVAEEPHPLPHAPVVANKAVPPDAPQDTQGLQGAQGAGVLPTVPNDSHAIVGGATQALSATESVEPEMPLPLGAVQGSQMKRAPSLRGLVEAVRLGAWSPTSVFEVRDGAVSIGVQGELLTRLVGLLSVEGHVEFAPERRRQRGRPVDVPFGQGEAQMMRARGNGVLHLDGDRRTFLSIELGDESVYLREETVFALEESVGYENGRMSVEEAHDFELVHLRGAGKVLLQLSGHLRSIRVVNGRGVMLPLAHLVGWQGELSPRIVSFGSQKAAGVEFSGDGFVLLALPSH